MQENTEMADASQTQSRKRKFNQVFAPVEIANRFSSKQDLITYLTDHCKFQSYTLTLTL